MRSARSHAGRCFRPRLETLEDRVYPGDALLGLWVLALWGSNSAAGDGTPRSEFGQNDTEWHPGLLATQDGTVSLEAGSLFTDSADERDGGGRVHASAVSVLNSGTATEANTLLFPDDVLARQVANYRLCYSPSLETQGLRLAMTGMPSTVGMAGSGTSASLFAAISAGNEQVSGRLPAGLAVALTSSHFVSAATLSFDASRGQLAIHTEGGPRMVREAVSSGRFVDVTLADQQYSSNPSSTAFDSGLAGATADTVASIRFEGGGQDTLTLSSQS